MNYSESIEKLKEEMCWADQRSGAKQTNIEKANQAIDRACALSLLQGQRQQHEKDVAKIKSIRSWADFVTIDRYEVVEALESTNPSLSPGEEGKK